MLSIKRNLTAEQIQAYETQGFVLVKDVLPKIELQVLNEQLQALWLERRSRDDLTDEHKNNIHSLSKNLPLAKQLSEDSRVLDLVASLVYPGISLFSAKLISKAPHQEKMICHWHQDDAYWQDISQGQRRLSVWIPLQDTHQNNGCLRVVPGSHRKGLIAHEPRSSRAYGQCRLSFLPGEKELPGMQICEVDAGSIILFSALTYHSSLGNLSAEHRRAFILTYQEATVPAGKDGEIRKDLRDRLLKMMAKTNDQLLYGPIEDPSGPDTPARTFERMWSKDQTGDYSIDLPPIWRNAPG